MSPRTRLKLNVAKQGYCRCVSRKIGYRSYDEALTAAEEMMAVGKVHPGCHITPYVCDECAEWHVRNRTIVCVMRGKRGSGQKRFERLS